MLKDSNDIKLTFKDKLYEFLFTVKDKETGQLRIRNSEFAQNLFRTHFQQKHEQTKKESYKFNLNTIIEYPKNFAAKYKTSNKPFVININKDQVIDIQLIHPSMMEIPNREVNEDFGFTIHLPFDSTQEEAMSELNKFKIKDYFDKFKYQSNDGIEDYILDCKEDYDLLDKMIKRILMDLKGYEATNEIFIDHFFV